MKLEKLPKSMLIKSPAKINLILDVQKRVDSGFHQLSTIIAKLPLADELNFSIWDEEKIIIEGDEFSTVKIKDNLIYKAGKLLQEKFNIKTGFVCRIKKVIPIRAGLGGGSSNGAATLIALNKLWQLNLTEKELIKLAQKLGSDMPFFINQARVILEPNHGNPEEEPVQYALDNLPNSWLLVIKPRFSVSTKQAFKLFDETESKKIQNNPTAELQVAQGLKDQNIEMIAKGTSNDFQDSLFTEKKIYQNATVILKKNGALNVTLTGTGSSFYAFFKIKEQAAKAQKELLAKYKHLTSFLLEMGDKS